MISRKQATIILSIEGYIRYGVNILRGLVLIPFYLKYIDVSVYGHWLASGGLLTFITITDIGLSRGVIQRIAFSFGKKNTDDIGGYFTNGLLIYIILSFVMIAIGLIASFGIKYIFDMDISSEIIIRHCFQIAVISSALAILNNLLFGFKTALLKPLVPAVFRLIWTILGIITTVVCLFRGYGLYALPLGTLISVTGTFISLIVIAFKQFKSLQYPIKYSKSHFIELLKISPYLFLAKTGNTIVKQIEPVLINIFIDPETTVAYVITKKVADYISVGWHIILGSFSASISHLYGENDVIKLRFVLNKLFSFFVFGSIISFTIYGGLNNYFIYLWVGNDFVINNIISILIGSSIFIRIFHNYISDILIFLGDIAFSSKYVMIESVSRIILMLFLVLSIGIYGIPIGMFISCSIFIFIISGRLIYQVGNVSIFPSVKFFSQTLFIATTIYLFNTQISYLINSWPYFVFVLLINFTIIITLIMLFKDIRIVFMSILKSLLKE